MSAVEFDYPETGYRWVETRWGESLQQLAARELLDAARWIDIVAINGLRPPYLSEAAGSGIAAYGDLLMVPSANTVASVSTDAGMVFERDVALVNGLLSGSADVALKSGVENLSQALSHRVIVDTKEMLFHPEYGCRVRELLGAVAGTNAGLLAGAYVRAALLKDPRVREVTSVDVQITGDQIAVRAEVIPIDGRPLQVIVGL